MQTGHRRVWLSALLLCLGLISRTTDTAGQTERFSATSEYRTILAELAQKAMRPSHLSAGELLEKSLPSVAVQATETAQTLKLEMAVCRLEIDKAHGRLVLTNKQTGIKWQTAAVDSGKAGISWVTDVDAKTASSPLSLTQVQSVQRQGNRWTMTGSVEGQSEPVNLELAV